MSRFTTSPLYIPLNKNNREIRGVRDYVNNDMVIVPNVKQKKQPVIDGTILDFGTERQVEMLSRNILLTEEIKEKAKEMIKGSGCCSGYDISGGCNMCGGSCKCGFVGSGKMKSINRLDNHHNRHTIEQGRFMNTPFRFMNNSMLGLEDNRSLSRIVNSNQI